MEGTKFEINRFAQSVWPPVLVFRYLVIGLLVGLIVSSWLVVPPPVGWLVGLMAWALIFWFRPRLLISFGLVGFCLAIWRWSLVVPPPAAQEFIGPQMFLAEVVEPPRLAGSSLKYLVKTINGHPLFLNLQARAFPAYVQGDRLQVDCSSVTPAVSLSQQRKNIWRTCAWPKLTYLSTNDKSFKVWLNRWNGRAGQSLKNLLPEPYATLASGMLWGDDNGLPAALVQAFRTTGTSHLLAVSGFNVTVLIQIIFAILISVGLWRRPASWLAIILIGLFVIFTGAEPAVVRAGIMGAVLLVGKLISRRASNINLLLGAAAVMLLFNPRLLFDLGFQLSFASMVGLGVVAPILQKKLKLLPNWLELREVLSQTVAAIIATLPVIIWQLGQVSLVSPLANLLIAPVVLLVFVLGLPLVLLAWLAGAWLTPLAWLLTAVLAYVVWVVETLAALPGAIFKTSLMVWPLLAVFYGWLSRFIYRNYQLLK